MQDTKPGVRTLQYDKDFKDLPLREFGNTIQISGSNYSQETPHRLYILQFPGESEPQEIVFVKISADDWQDLLRQTDQMETEILAKAKDGTLTKAIVRKCTRQIEQGVSWNVYRRDGYACRYCANDKVPLTVDHLVLWEEGGPSIEANLVSACRKCNKARGNMQYSEWLASGFYGNASKNLTTTQRLANIKLADTLAAIPRKHHIASR